MATTTTASDDDSLEKKLTYAYSIGFVFGALVLFVLNRVVASILGTLFAILFVFAAFYIGLWWVKHDYGETVTG